MFILTPQVPLWISFLCMRPSHFSYPYIYPSYHLSFLLFSHSSFRSIHRCHLSFFPWIYHTIHLSHHLFLLSISYHLFSSLSICPSLSFIYSLLPSALPCIHPSPLFIISGLANANGRCLLSFPSPYPPSMCAVLPLFSFLVLPPIFRQHHLPHFFFALRQLFYEAVCSF